MNMQKNFMNKAILRMSLKKIWFHIQVGNPLLVLLLVTCYLLFSSTTNFFSNSRDVAMFLKNIVIVFSPMNLWSMIYIATTFWTFVDPMFGEALVG